MKRLILAPFALMAAGLFIVTTHIFFTSLLHRSTWTPATGTIVSALTRCEVTYRPADGVLRESAALVPCAQAETVKLPPGAKRPRIEKQQVGEIRYEVAGRERRWSGKMADARLFNVKAGDVVALVYNPSSPNVIDSAEPMKGWFGAVLIWFGSLAIVILYLWFVWPRRKGPPASPKGENFELRDPVPEPVRTSPRPSGPATFGKRGAAQSFGRAR